jgi:hypothetical protein
LDEDRIPLLHYDRYEHTDHDWGVCFEPGTIRGQCYGLKNILPKSGIFTPNVTAIQAEKNDHAIGLQEKSAFFPQKTLPVCLSSQKTIHGNENCYHKYVTSVFKKLPELLKSCRL